MSLLLGPLAVDVQTVDLLLKRPRSYVPIPEPYVPATDRLDVALGGPDLSAYGSVDVTDELDVAAISTLDCYGALGLADEADAAALTGFIVPCGTLALADEDDISSVQVDIGTVSVTATGQVPAGRSRRIKRRKVIIGERAYMVSDRELPGIIQAILTKPPEPVKPLVRAAREDVRKEAQPVPVEVPQPWMPVAQAIRQQFEVANDADALLALAIALERLQQEDDDEVMMLMAA